MRNDECTIYISTKTGWVQSYRKGPGGWTQTLPSGVTRSLTAEQLLSHLLPRLAVGGWSISVKVEADEVSER